MLKMGIKNKIKNTYTVHKKGENEEDNKDKNRFFNFSHTSSPLSQIQCGEHVFITKVTLFQAWIMAIPHHAMNKQSTFGYFKGLLDLGQEKIKEKRKIAY